MASDSSKKKRVSWLWWAMLSIVIFGFTDFCNPLSYPHIGSRGYLLEISHNGKQLVSLTKRYASEHQGAYPHDFRELEKACPDIDFRNLLKSLLKKDQPLGWVYLNGLHDEAAPDRPVFVSPLLQDTNGTFVRWFRFNVLKKANLLPTTPTRVVATADGSAQAMSEDELQALIAKHHLALPVSSSTEAK